MRAPLGSSTNRFQNTGAMILGQANVPQGGGGNSLSFFGIKSEAP